MKIEAVERALLQLATKLDKPYGPPSDPDQVFMALGHRARSLYRGFLVCIESGEVVAARALLRPMVETNILLRYIQQEPEWRTQLWMAESKRVWLGIVDQIRVRPLPPAQKFGGLPTADEIAQVRKQIEELRESARAAGVTGVPPRGRLLPIVQEQVESLNTTEAWQAFVVAYMPLTFEQHISHGSFAAAVQYRTKDGRVVHHEPEELQPGQRLLASSVFASTLVIVSSWLGLGFEDAADRLRAQVVGETEQA